MCVRKFGCLVCRLLDTGNEQDNIMNDTGEDGDDVSDRGDDVSDRGNDNNIGDGDDFCDGGDMGEITTCARCYPLGITTYTYETHC
jgi:hypothetical protein